MKNTNKIKTELDVGDLHVFREVLDHHTIHATFPDPNIQACRLVSYCIFCLLGSFRFFGQFITVPTSLLLLRQIHTRPLHGPARFLYCHWNCQLRRGCGNSEHADADDLESFYRSSEKNRGNGHLSLRSLVCLGPMLWLLYVIARGLRFSLQSRNTDAGAY